jgi:hypothetical protein
LAKTPRADREALVEKRLLVNLRAHGIATARTLEQKISDAGPFNQRIDPHILTPVRNRLVADKKISEYEFEGVKWFFLPDIAQAKLGERFHAQLPVYRALNGGNFADAPRPDANCHVQGAARRAARRIPWPISRPRRA